MLEGVWAVVHFKYYFNRRAIKDGSSGKILSKRTWKPKDYKEEKMMILDDKRKIMLDLYNQLHGLGICKTRYEFSYYWLSRSKRYYSSVINENRDISIEPLMNAISRLRLLAIECKNSRHTLLIEKGVKLNTIRAGLELSITRCITYGLHGGK